MSSNEFKDWCSKNVDLTKQEQKNPEKDQVVKLQETNENLENKVNNLIEENHVLKDEIKELKTLVQKLEALLKQLREFFSKLFPKKNIEVTTVTTNPTSKDLPNS